MTTCVTEGVRQERHQKGTFFFLLLGLLPSFIASTLKRACTPLTKSEEKKTAHSLSLQITDEQILVLTDRLVVEMIKLVHAKSH